MRKMTQLSRQIAVVLEMDNMPKRRRQVTRQEQARRALDKEATRLKVPADVAWFGDEEDDKTYTWKYTHNGVLTKMVYCYESKTITIGGVK